MFRLIEQNMLNEIVACKSTRLIHDAFEKINAACLQAIGLSWEIVTKSSPEGLADLLKQSSGGYGRMLFLSELLIQDADLQEMGGNSIGMTRSLVQAFYLLSEATAATQLYGDAEYLAKLDSLALRLRPVSGSPYIEEMIRKHFLRRESVVKSR